MLFIKNIIFYSILSLFWLITRLPHTIVLLFGKWLGLLVYIVLPKIRTITKINIEACFPDKSTSEQDKLVKQSFISFGMGIMEIMTAWLVKSKNLPKLNNIEGIEHIENAIASSENIILLGLHQFSAELVGRIFNQIHPMNAVYQKVNDHTLNQLVLKQRSNIYPKVIPNHNIRLMIKSLQDKEMLWFAPDQAPNKRHRVFVPFFNIMTATSTSTSTLAKLSNSIVIPVSCYRDNGGYVAIMHPKLENFPSGDDETDATQINDVLQKIITKHPEQYLWQYKRFKITPDGTTHIYDRALKNK